MAKSTYASNRCLTYLLPSASVYLALFSTEPAVPAGIGGTEVSAAGTAYARQAISFGAAAAGSVANSAQITFAQATASWGTITSFGIYDAATGGNLLYVDVLPGGSIAINFTSGYGDQFVVPVGSLVISES